MYSKYESEEREKQRIYETALSLMDEVGYEKVTIRSLCSRAGISTGKFYYYFRSKEDMMSLFFDHAIEEFQEHINQQDFNAMDIKEQIVNYYVWYTEYTSSFGLDFVIHFYNNQNQAFNYESSNVAVVALTEEFFQKAVQNGYVVPDGKTINQIARDICVIVKGCIFNWCVQRGKFNLPEYTRDLLTRCVRGLL